MKGRSISDTEVNSDFKESTHQVIGDVDAYISAERAKGRALKNIAPDVSGVLYRGDDPLLKDLYKKTQIAENLKRDEPIPTLHPLIKERLEGYQDKAEGLGFDRSGEILGKDLPGRHAEVLATNQLLLEIEKRGIKIKTQDELENILKDVVIYNGLVPRSESSKYKPGESMVRCSNCQILTDGDLSLSDLPFRFWQKHFPEYMDRITNPTILHEATNSEGDNKK